MYPSLGIGRAPQARYPEAWDVSRLCIGPVTPSTPCSIRSSPSTWRPSWTRWRRPAPARVKILNVRGRRPGMLGMIFRVAPLLLCSPDGSYQEEHMAMPLHEILERRFGVNQDEFAAALVEFADRAGPLALIDIHPADYFGDPQRATLRKLGASLEPLQPDELGPVAGLAAAHAELVKHSLSVATVAKRLGVDPASANASTHARCTPSSSAAHGWCPPSSSTAASSSPASTSPSADCRRCCTRSQ